jgi:hypothetical protein
MANESLQASFGLDTAPLEQSLKRAGDRIKQFAVAFVSFETAKKALEGLKESLDLGSHLLDLSNKTGIGTGALYDLGEAGRDVGLSLEEITSSVNKMQRSLGKAENANLLHALGLDPQSLASAKPEQAFQKIGQAIAALPNSTERTIAAMQLFGKTGAQMLQLFNDPSFKNGIGSSQAGQLLEQNSATFDKLSDALGKTGPRLKEFFIGFNSENAANIERMANAMEEIGAAQAGVSAGTIVASFSQSVANGQFGELLILSMQIAVEKFINAFLGGVLTVGRALYEVIELIFRKETFQVLGDTLMAFINSFNATLLTGISKAIGLLSSAPFVGGSAAKLSASASNLASSYSLAASQQGGRAADLSGELLKYVGKKAADSFDWGKVFNTDSAEARLSALTDSLQLSKNSANQEARDKSAGRSLDQSAFNVGNLGMGGPVIADSLQRVGGGGSFMNPNGLADVQREHLNETKKSNTLLQQILTKSQISPVMMAVLGQS